MQKFGLFDLIEKILPQTKAENDKSTNENSSVVNATTPNNSRQKDSPKRNNNLAPYYSLIKRHDEISKRIDKQKK